MRRRPIWHVATESVSSGMGGIHGAMPALGRWAEDKRLAMPPHDISHQTIDCELCRTSGPVHYRVRTRLLKTWTMVCPHC